MKIPFRPFRPSALAKRLGLRQSSGAFPRSSSVFIRVYPWLLLLLLLTSCASSPTRVTFNAESATATLVDQAMTAWGAYVAQYHPPASQERIIQARFEQYQAAMTAVIDATRLAVTLTAAGSTNAPSSDDRRQLAQNQAAQALSDLLSALHAFGVR